MKTMPPFHLAFPVRDIEETREFYRDTVGCKIGREDTRWIDFDLFGHQVSAHKADVMPEIPTNPVDGKQVPAFHFGAILEWDEWHTLADRFREMNCDFIIEPYIRFKGQPGEQATMFLRDPSGNGLEFKAFRDKKSIFAT